MEEFGGSSEAAAGLSTSTSAAAGSKGGGKLDRAGGILQRRLVRIYSPGNVAVDGLVPVGQPLLHWLVYGTHIPGGDIKALGASTHVLLFVQCLCVYQNIVVPVSVSQYHHSIPYSSRIPLFDAGRSGDPVTLSSVPRPSVFSQIPRFWHYICSSLC